MEEMMLSPLYRWDLEPVDLGMGPGSKISHLLKLRLSYFSSLSLCIFICRKG